MDIRIKRPEIKVMPHAQRGLKVLAGHAPKAEALGHRVEGPRERALLGASFDRGAHVEVAARDLLRGVSQPPHRPRDLSRQHDARRQA